MIFSEVHSISYDFLVIICAEKIKNNQSKLQMINCRVAKSVVVHVKHHHKLLYRDHIYHA